ncbi:MAG: Stage sporulation protein, partial [Thermosediminibacterales bacterium]|nr:Stage sporulation protein [Thermosediminibacterales bacterium]
MLLKLLGALIIVITSSWIGFIIAGYYRERPKQ